MRIIRPQGKATFRNWHVAEPEQHSAFDLQRSTDPGHFYSWNVQTLANLLIDSGYEFQSGKVARCPDEEVTLRWAQKLNLGESGFRIAAAACHLFKPDFEVRVAVKRPQD